MAIRNANRTVGAMLSGEIAKRYGEEGLPRDTFTARFTGSAEQSFAAFLAKGVSFRLEGDANDYFAKGASGGEIVVVPPKEATYVPEENIIVGNVALYGATGGEVFIRGMAGERFCVRNSGAHAVVEGVGDHGCEYMTNGRAIILGRAGRNFAAGMSGGVAFVLDEAGDFAEKACNHSMVDLEPFDAPEDILVVRTLIERHLECTKSPKAEWVLGNWEKMLPKFIKIYPKELTRVLRERQEREMVSAAGGD
jgi:glutamate synthase domain-containing protein 3